MGISRSDAIDRIEAQRACIREHIDKYYRYEMDYDKAFALKTIENCQRNIEHLKNSCSCDIDSSYEDTWRP